MAYPTKYSRQYDFGAYQNANPTRPLPADKVNADLNAVATSIDETVEFLKGITRSDGEIANESVGFDQLTTEVKAQLGDEDAVAEILEARDDAATSETNAAASAVAAAASQTAAASSASAASTSASGASTSAGAASTSASAAAASAVTAAANATVVAGNKYLFASSTTMADPSSGNVRFNNATLASVTSIAISANSGDSGAPDVSDFIAIWGASTNTALRGTLLIRKIGSPGDYRTYTITSAVTDNGTWLQMTVAHASGAGSFTAADQLSIQWSRSGDKGTGDLLSSNNLSDLTAKYTAKDNLSVHGADVASATTTNLETATGDLIDVTGTTTITAITLSDGHERTVRFTGILILTHGASLVLPGAASITTAAGDFAVFRGYAAGVVRCVEYTKVSGKSVIFPSLTDLSARGQGRETISIPAAAMTIRTTNGPSVGTVEMSSNKNMFVTKDFDTTTQEFVQFEVPFPKSWNLGTVTFQPIWSHASTTTNFGVVWALQAVARSDDDPGDVAFGTEQTSTDTGGTTNDIYIGPESAAITIAGTPATGDTVQFQLKRNPADGSDTLAVDARLHAIKIYFTTNAPTDT